MEGDEGLQAADASSADEDCRSAVREGLDVVVVGEREGGDLLIVKFDDGRVDADGGKEVLHDVAHAAGGSGEDDDGMLRDEALDSSLGGLVDVDGQGGRGRRRSGVSHGSEVQGKD